MFTKIINWLTQSTYQSALEAFITSKYPTSAAEVEHWTKVYERRDDYTWGRGL